MIALSLLGLGGLIIIACVVYHLLVQQGKILLRLESLERSLAAQGIATGNQAEPLPGLPPGSLLNDFELPALLGGVRRLSDWRGRKPLLIFFNPSCSYCQAMAPQLAAIEAAESGDAPTIVIISTGEIEENRKYFQPLGIRHPILIQEGTEVSTHYRVFGTPMGYLVDETGITNGALLVGSEALLAAARQTDAFAVAPVPADGRAGRAFSRYVGRSRLRRDGLDAGTPAPAFSLPRLDGPELSLAEFRGHRTLLVFSDPACGPCDELAPKLEQVHRRRQELRVVMISRGDPEANRKKVAEVGLTFPIVLQRHWEISRAYGMFATPIAYQIDEQGVLASDVLVGVAAILKAVSRKALRAHGRATMSVSAYGGHRVPRWAGNIITRRDE